MREEEGRVVLYRLWRRFYLVSTEMKRLPQRLGIRSRVWGTSVAGAFHCQAENCCFLGSGWKIPSTHASTLLDDDLIYQGKGGKEGEDEGSAHTEPHSHLSYGLQD